jgi:SAM-dependent methyltransferase
VTINLSGVDWTDVAGAWGARRQHVEQMKAELTARLLDGLQLRGGERVLELGAGTGELSRRLAERVGPRGRVLASDVAPGMLELIRRTVAGLPNVEVAELDARDLTLDNGCVDAVAFRMGLMLIEEPGTALGECHRVLTSGGRLAVAVWGAPQHNPWLASVGMAAMMHGLVTTGPPTGPGGPFALSDPQRLAQLFDAAGFADVQVTEVATSAHFATTDAHFDTVLGLAGPLAAAVGGAPEETRQAVRATAAELAGRYRTDSGVTLPGLALLCTGRR